MNKTTDTYISLNKEELVRLNGLSYEAFGLYMRLKEKANFRTGVVGRFFNQKLNYAVFAKLMARPTSQGRAALEFDSTAIKRLLAQLEDVGLVADHAFKDQRLTLRLPLSPLWKDNPELIAINGKLPSEKLAKSAQSKSQQASSQVPQDGSVMTSKRGSIPFFSSVSNDPGGVAASHFPKERDAHPAATAPGKSAPRSGDQVGRFEAMISKSGGVGADRPECRKAYARWASLGVGERELETAICLATLGGEPTFDPLELDGCFANPSAFDRMQSHQPVTQNNLVADYESCLKAAGGIFLTTEISRDIFSSWQQAKVTVEAVKRAIADRAAKDSSPLRPGDLNRWLFPSDAMIREEQKRAMRCGVAL